MMVAANATGVLATYAVYDYGIVEQGEGIHDKIRILPATSQGKRSAMIGVRARQRLAFVPVNLRHLSSIPRRFSFVDSTLIFVFSSLFGLRLSPGLDASTLPRR
eukprot:2168936-Prymnesium_polylepis.1